MGTEKFSRMAAGGAGGEFPCRGTLDFDPGGDDFLIKRIREKLMIVRTFFYALIGLSLFLFCSAAGIPAAADQPAAGPEAARPANPPLTAIQVSFKVREITPQSFFMGDLWVPNITTVDVGKTVTVEAKAVGLDAQNKQMDINPAWKAGDPTMIGLAPDQGPRVKLTVLKPGQSSVTVTVGKISKKLAIKAWITDNTIYARITQ